MKQIAVIGSSGGNLYNQGGSDVETMIKEIVLQANSGDMHVAFGQFVCSDTSMDNIDDQHQASLYIYQNDTLDCVFEGTLKEVNAQASSYDKQLSKLIEDDAIDGMCLLSCDPHGVNAQALQQASLKQIPLVGTGGTSIANVQNMGCRVISASGTTGTTSRTRAVSFMTSFAKEWHLSYHPVIGKTGESAIQEMQTNVFQRINFRGIMMTSLPAFIAMALCLALSKIPGLSQLEDIFNTLIGSLPIVIAAIAAKQISGLDEVGVVSGIIAGILAKDGGIIGGLIVGILAGILSYYIIMFCFKMNVPGTTANIASGGIGGLVAGFIGLYCLTPVALWLGHTICDVINSAIAFNPILAGAVAGLLIWPAIIGGVYHAAILPIVLLEMEAEGFSFLGAVDMCGLVMVSAGITLACVLFPKEKSDRAVAAPGCLINIAFGTFVEAAYPFMFSSKIVFGGALVASTVANALVGLFNVKGTAYVPAFVAPTLANSGKGIYFFICMFVAMAIAFVFTFINNRMYTHKDNQ